MSLEEMVKKLPAELQQEAKDYIQFLLEKRSKSQKKKPQLKWVGALRELRTQYTSVELQHKIMQWRVGEP